MSKLTLLEWIRKNKEKWELICGVNNKKPTKNEIKTLFREILDLAYESIEFDTVFTVFLSRYYYDLFPNVLDENNDSD